MTEPGIGAGSGGPGQVMANILHILMTKANSAGPWHYSRAGLPREDLFGTEHQIGEMGHANQSMQHVPAVPDMSQHKASKSEICIF